MFFKPNYPFLKLIICVNFLILFGASTLRHNLFQSKAFDLGIYDQVVYLISQGKPPISSILDFHHLGNHGAFSVYILGLFYKIYPTVYWLLAIQALCLSIAVLPCWLLAKRAGLQRNQCLIIVFVYLLYPLTFNVNLFDFHPEVIAIPLLFTAILSAKTNRYSIFVLSIIFILGCKAVLSLTVIALGLWLIFFEKKHFCGVFAVISGLSWFILVTMLIIPYFSGKQVAAVGRYNFLGNSVLEIIQNFIFRPDIVLEKIFNLTNLEYVCLLFIPVIWGLSLKHLTNLIPAIPCFSLNILTDYIAQKDLIHQYSLPILPFLILTVISSWAAKDNLFKNRNHIIIWSLVGFLVLGKFGYFWTKYLEYTDNLAATNRAIALVKNDGSVLTSAQIAPHLTHRISLELAIDENKNMDLNQFQYILLNKRHPGWESSPETIAYFVEWLEDSTKFKCIYDQDDVVLFESLPSFLP